MLRRFLFVLPLIILLFVLSYQRSYAAVNWQDANIIYKKLVIKSGIKNAPPLFLVRSDYPNASCTFKGIAVTSGELLMDSKAGLAGVLGHELTHFKYGDIYHVPMSYYEIRSDREGLKLAQKLGYKRCAILEFMRVDSYMFGPGGGDGIHPTWKVRYNLLKGKCKPIRSR